MAAVQHINDFMILGPAMASGDKVLKTIDALYFLPDNFKLILTGSETADQSFFSRVKSQVEHYDLSSRVWFSDDKSDADVVVLPQSDTGKSPKSVAGDSPEALASAILNFARA